MSTSFNFRPLKPLELTDMYLAFTDSFSDYEVAFKLSKEQFVRKFVEKLKIDFSLSIGAFDYDALAGFIFTSLNVYEGKLTAYNGGTGVRPAYRGNKLVKQIYDYLTPLLLQKNVKQCVLEVLDNNTKAIKAYSAIGFEQTKYFRCFKFNQPELNDYAPKIDIEIVSVSKPDWFLYDNFSNYNPSFLDSSKMINDNLANEQFIEAKYNDECIGYAIYQSAFGRISQMAVDPDYRRKGVGSSLINYILLHSHNKALTVINVNEWAKETIDFYERLGFTNQLNQLEMTLYLD